MAFRAWRLCVVVVAVCSWQACKAQGLVNLMPPWRFTRTPGLGRTLHNHAFDQDYSTYATVNAGRYASFCGARGTTIRATAFRITLAPDSRQPKTFDPMRQTYVLGGAVSSREDTLTRPKRRSRCSSKDSKIFQLARFSGALFKNGVYEGILDQPKDITDVFMRLARTGAYVWIAEIELLGTRKELDALWPYGKYPCSRHLAMITRRSGPKIVFSRANNPIEKRELRRLFKGEGSRNRFSGLQRRFEFAGLKPVMIGARSEELVDVKEVTVPTEEGLHAKKIVLQGNPCVENRCNKYGTKGWVRLAVAKPAKGYADPASGWPDGARIPIEHPGSYKALRLKFYPATRRSGDTESFHIEGIYFLGCTA